MNMPASGQRILVVDDEPVVRSVLVCTLEEEGYRVSEADCAEKALELFRIAPFPLVFADIVMPGQSGISLLQKIKEQAPETQVIMITSHASLDTAIMALRFGANEYLMKPFDDICQVSQMARQAFEKLERIRNNDQQIHALKRQITELEGKNREFKELSIRDGLTGLYNHRYFQATLSVEISRAERHGREFSIIFLDLDHFKQYNDTHGHPQGDELLKTVAGLMSERLRVSDVLARYGGEEFIIILPETGLKDTLRVARSIRSLIESYPFANCETQPLGHVTASLGVATYPAHGRDARTLLEQADQALYRAKQGGRNRVCEPGN